MSGQGRGQRSRRSVAPTLVLAAGLALACAPPGPVDRLVRYREQVTGLLGDRVEPAAPAAAARVLPYPRRRERWIEIEDRRMTGVDFLAIQGCRLSELVGHRNSQLGRTMPPSRQLVYELDVLAEASVCLEGLSGERAARLGAMLEAKRDELPGHVFNAVWNGEEMPAFLADGPVVRLGAGELAENAPGLVAVRGVLARGVATRADGEALEAALSRLREGLGMGPIFTALQAIGNELDAVSALVEAHAVDRCESLEIRLFQIFQASYLSMQSEIARLDRGAAARIDLLDEIFEGSVAGLSAPPDPMLAYHRARLSSKAPGGVFQSWRGAIDRHARAWEPLLRACDALPEA